jgi:hypothetical protein
MADIIKISDALIETNPDLMTWMNVSAIQRKVDGITGALKYVPWITLWNFRVTEAKQITVFAEMSFWPNTTGSYDTEGDAISAAWEFVNTELIGHKWIFTAIWNQWATE